MRRRKKRTSKRSRMRRKMRRRMSPLPRYGGAGVLGDPGGGHRHEARALQAHRSVLELGWWTKNKNSDLLF